MNANPNLLCVCVIQPDQSIIAKMSPILGPFTGIEVIIKMTLPSEYPFKAPDARFLTPVYHPNVSDEGQVCKDILSGDWGPAKQIIDIVAAIENFSPHHLLEVDHSIRKPRSSTKPTPQRKLRRNKS